MSLPGVDVSRVFRDASPRAIATLIRLLGNIDLAEEAVQEAFEIALVRWPRDGAPTNPGGWITTTARNRAIDRLRREALRSNKEGAAHAMAAVDADQGAQTFVEDAGVGDDRLRLIFTCCHPAIGAEARVALTLRTLCGLTTAEIAAAFGVPEPTMAQRLVRTKRKIAVAHIPYRVPAGHELGARLRSVCKVIEVILIEGSHASSDASLVRVDLVAESVRLARLLVELMPDEAEAIGLLALCLASQARGTTKVGPDGGLVLLADQDRSQWDHALVSEAHDLVDRALRLRHVGPFQAKAAIACLHGLAPDGASTDWPQIAALYRILWDHEPTPSVGLNRVVAIGEADGPPAALAALAALVGGASETDRATLDRWHLRHGVAADLHRRDGRADLAGDAYRRALACATAPPADRTFLERRLADLDGSLVFGRDS